MYKVRSVDQMQRNGSRFRNDILIDLTSLLDVIFIILLVLVCGQTTISDDLNGRIRKNAGRGGKTVIRRTAGNI